MDKHTKTWLDNQALWKDLDLGIAMVVAFVAGFSIGAIIFW